jgi:hypothetical protein
VLAAFDPAVASILIPALRALRLNIAAILHCE